MAETHRESTWQEACVPSPGAPCPDLCLFTNLEAGSPQNAVFLGFPGGCITWAQLIKSLATEDGQAGLTSSPGGVDGKFQPLIAWLVLLVTSPSPHQHNKRHIYQSQHLGNSKSFKSPVPEMGTKTRFASGENSRCRGLPAPPSSRLQGLCPEGGVGIWVGPAGAGEAWHPLRGEARRRCPPWLEAHSAPPGGRPRPGEQKRVRGSGTL